MKFTPFFTAAAISAIGWVPLAAAQSSSQGAGQTWLQPHITVTGEAERRAMPDLARITLGVTAQADEAQAAVAEMSEAMAALIGDLRAAGIKTEDLQTLQVSLNPQWSNGSSLKRYDAPEVVGFVASNSLQVTIRDLDRLAEVLDRTLAAGGNRFSGLQFDLSDTSALRDGLRVEAVEDAVGKARLLAKAAGVRLGSVRVIEDQGAQHGPGPVMMRAAAMESAAVAAGQLEFRHQVRVIFDVIPQAQ